MDNRKFFLLILRRYPWRLLLVFLLNLISVILSILVFILIEPFSKLLFLGNLDNLSPISSFFVAQLSSFVNFSRYAESVSYLILSAVLLFLLKNVFAYASQWVMASVRSNLLFYLRNLLYNKVLSLPLGYFSLQRRGDLVSKAVNDTQEIEFTILTALKSFMTDPLSALIFVFVLFYINPTLSVFAIVLLPLTFVVIGRVSHSLRKDSRGAKVKLGSLLSHVEESLSGLRIIKGFNAQNNAESVFSRLNDDFAGSQKHIYRKYDLSSPLSEFFGVAIVMVVLIIGGSMVLSPGNGFSAELFITYIALFTQIITPIKNLSTAVAGYKRGQSAIDRIHEILDADDVIVQRVDPIEVSDFKSEVTFKDVCFAYDKVEILSNLSFSLHKGEVLALIGQSGAGKTTITDLLERFYDPVKGSVFLDGVDIRDYNIAQYRSLFSLVSQDVVLFNDTIYNNIVLGLEGVPEDKVWEALKIANMYDFVCSLPDRLEHQIGDRGLMLSGGQRQRLSIARAVLRNSPILILDEATSAMDTESERLVQQALDTLMQQRTVLVIAHRLSTIQGADQILVLDKGRVVERGNHESLMCQDGLYKQLVEIQQFK